MRPPAQEWIAIAPCEARYHPQIRARASHFTKFELHDHNEGPDLERARVQRTQLDSMELEGGHGFGQKLMGPCQNTPCLASSLGNRMTNSIAVTLRCILVSFIL